MNSRIATLIAPVLVVGLACACTTTLPNSLADMKAEQVRTLAIACYRQNRDTALTFGGGPVWLACMEQARSKIR